MTAFTINILLSLKPATDVSRNTRETDFWKITNCDTCLADSRTRSFFSRKQSISLEHLHGMSVARFKSPLIFILVPHLMYYFYWLQRGSDELLSQSAVSVMAPATPHHADNNNQDNAKKVSYIIIISISIKRILLPS